MDFDIVLETNTQDRSKVAADKPGPLSFRLGPLNFRQYTYPSSAAIPVYSNASFLFELF